MWRGCAGQGKGDHTPILFIAHRNEVIVMQIRIFDVTEVIPEPNKPLTKNKLKVARLEQLACRDVMLFALVPV